MIFLGWIAAAFAVLTKGFAGIVLPLAVAVFVAFRSNRLRELFRGEWLLGALAHVVIVGVWFSIHAHWNLGFARHFVVFEHVARFLTEKHEREGFFGYYVAMIAVGMLPWSVDLGRELSINLRRVFARPIRLPDPVVLWAAVPFVFFSLAGSKLASYVLPCFPPLAIFLAMRGCVLAVATCAHGMVGDRGSRGRDGRRARRRHRAGLPILD